MALINASNDLVKTPEAGPASRTWTLFLISTLGLFLELLLIRWVSTEIRIFAYLQNTVLVVCFLGLGMGCWTSRQQSAGVRRFFIPLFLLVLLLAIPVSRAGLSKISELLSLLGGLLIWYEGISNNPWETAYQVALGLVLTYLLMFLIWNIFVPIGQGMGRLLDEHPRPIWAYSVNVAGSLLGIWLFVLLSVLNQPPVAWFALAASMSFFFIGRSGRSRLLDGGLLAGTLVLAWFAGRESGSMEVNWSPYQKLSLWEVERTSAKDKAYFVKVNNTGFQLMLDLRAEHFQTTPENYPAEMRGLTQYDIPPCLHPRPEKLLIVGAGAGNDAAGGIRNRVANIVAVEIDPTVIALGKRYHPEKPYDSSAVWVVNDDARSFFSTCSERFDVISFSLLDSHTTTAMTNARLDHYVYTRESIQRAKSLLANPGGILVLSFEAEKSYIADRMARVLREVFDQEPLYFRIPDSGAQYGFGGIMFVTGDVETAKKQIAENARLATLVRQWQQDRPLSLPGTTPVATDDWPYIYLENPGIPPLYYFLAVLLILLFIQGARQLRTPISIAGWERGHWHFFFLGAAFLLLEVQNISKAAVVLGNTWLVNAVIISSILCLILLANWIVARFPGLPFWPIYGFLFGTCLVLYFVDLSRFGFLPSAGRMALVGGLTSLPLLFGGVIFIRSFAVVDRKDQALGANLLGALAGGLLQSVTFVTGIKALLLIVAGLYLAALLTKAPTLPGFAGSGNNRNDL